MLFPTLDFGLFFLIIFVLVWSIRSSNEWRKIILLLASWVFYGAWDWRFVALLIASAFLNWGAARYIDREDMPQPRRKMFLVAGIVANLAILGFFKYYGFFLESVGDVLHNLGWQRDLPILEIILPVGVSFFTFQGMSYLIDVYRKRVPSASLLDITLMMSFFPHLVAGPIVRASHLIPQFRKIPKLDRGMAAMALLLIVWGLFKKSVIASELSTSLVDKVFFDPSAHSSLELLIGAYGYAVQIYCDFSAYSDMAIGLAALLGYRFPVNFNQPYRAHSLQNFWRRWHISLSSWLRDYLYIGLGGNRGGLYFICRNLMITMLLGGIWHGAKWTFLIWGGLHGLVLAIERIWQDYRPKGWPELPKVLGVLITFHIVVIGWIFFRADSFDGALGYLHGLFRMTGGIGIVTPLGIGLIVMGMLMHFTPPAMMPNIALAFRRIPAPLAGFGIGLLILLIDAMRYEGVAPFIYYQF